MKKSGVTNYLKRISQTLENKKENLVVVQTKVLTDVLHKNKKANTRKWASRLSK